LQRAEAQAEKVPIALEAASKAERRKEDQGIASNIEGIEQATPSLCHQGA
jgi:hypothetical protein